MNYVADLQTKNELNLFNLRNIFDHTDEKSRKQKLLPMNHQIAHCHPFIHFMYANNSNQK